VWLHHLLNCNRRAALQGLNECIASNDSFFGIECNLSARASAPAPLYGIKPRIQEKSCVVELGTTGVQLPFWFWLQAYPT
jgi:hypothetical protein